MLTCVYHPIDAFRVVEDDEADRLKALGVWFDCPTKARKYKDQIEAELKSAPKLEASKPKVIGIKTKLKEKSK
jgi:hypothetical protein